MEKTCAIIKPDAVRSQHVGDILSEIVKNDMLVVDLFSIRLTEEQAGEFYSEHKGRPYFDSLVQFTTSGSMVVMTLEGKDVVARWRELIGATNPANAKPGTLRAKFGRGTPNNALHGSDSASSAKLEIEFLRKLGNRPALPDL
jgi:nucleoside-diphosphate kinase